MPSNHVHTFLEAPFRAYLALWLPILFSMVAEPLTGLVDTAFVARLGSEALAALGVGTVVLTGGLWLFNFLSVGSQTEISQARGCGDLARGRGFASLALGVALVAGGIMGCAAFLSAPQLASLMGASDNVHEATVTYIQLRALGGPAVLATMVCFGILYGMADTRTPLLIAITVNGLNILLDWLLIFGIGPLEPLGIAGAAIASTISQWIGCAVIVLQVRNTLGFDVKIAPADVFKMLRVGRDMFLRTGSLILFLLLATRMATRMGSEAGAAHQAIRQVWVFTTLFLDASAVTAQSVIGYHFGLGDADKARRVAAFVTRNGILIGFVLLLAMLVLSGPVTALLVPQESIRIFQPAWAVAAIMQPVAALAFVTDGIHWGTGDYRYLRNCVIVATLCASGALAILDLAGGERVAAIWWVIGGWVGLRALFGIVRIWPGSPESPLALSRKP